MLKSLLLFLQKTFKTNTQLKLEIIFLTTIRNISAEIISIDFLTIPTINFKLLHVLVVIEQDWRKLIYFNVTKNPTAEWSIQQIRNLLFDHNAPNI